MKKKNLDNPYCVGENSLGVGDTACGAAADANRVWPCIKGHRIWVSLILDFLAGGATIAEILEDYPQLETEDILACIAYGAEMSRVRFVDIPVESAA